MLNVYYPAEKSTSVVNSDGLKKKKNLIGPKFDAHGTDSLIRPPKTLHWVEVFGICIDNAALSSLTITPLGCTKTSKPRSIQATATMSISRWPGMFFFKSLSIVLMWH